MRKLNIIFLMVLGIFIISCTSFLDVIPDNIPTVEMAFNNRNEAEGYLFGCYSFIPNHANINSNPALAGGDEVWLINPIYGIGEPILWNIARGEQGTNLPLANYWTSHQDGTSANGGKRLWTGIRDCNIFLENIHLPFDLQEWERRQWIAEAKFIKAYLHFWLFRMYGPIPLIKENLPISASSDEVKIYREPIDEVVDYIVELLDESANDLPIEITDVSSNMGRPTKPIALALKAQVLTYAASPLFNGNSDYAGIVDNRGIYLFPEEYEEEKWERAAKALKEAIDTCHIAGHELFDFRSTPFSTNLNDSTIMSMQVSGAATERWNKEIVWGDANSSTSGLQKICMPGFFPAHGGGTINPSYAPTMRVVEQFYSNHGVPIEEDIDWIDINNLELRTGDETHKYFIEKGYTTINLHFNREPRFYGAISFDGGKFYGNGRIMNDKELLTVKMIYGGGGVFVDDRHSSTGYLVKKMVHYMSSITDVGATATFYRYPFPLIRLADLYLMYAEALNEIKASPDADVYEYIDYVRERTGLEGVVQSWMQYSKFPDKPLNKEGMREIIQRERMNELAFEGSRFWDLRRWKLAEKYMNQPIRGLHIYEEVPSEFYKLQNIFDLSFEKKDYLWPIMQLELTKNHNLIQNPGW